MIASSDSALPPLGSIQLLLVEPDRAIEHAPSGVSVGTITLGAWHISRVPRVPGSLDGHGAYLIRIPYDLDLEPGKPAPRRFEIGLATAVITALAGVIGAVLFFLLSRQNQYQSGRPRALLARVRAA